jgi:hypothetical protein
MFYQHVSITPIIIVLWIPVLQQLLNFGENIKGITVLSNEKADCHSHTEMEGNQGCQRAVVLTIIIIITIS